MRKQNQIEVFSANLKRMSEWIKVIFLADCLVKDWDEDKEFALCPICLIEYADCKHPGPTQEDEYEYQEINGELFARKKNS